MPAPRAMPRVPVSRQMLDVQKTAPRIVQGPATIFDGEKLRVDDSDLRLFGIVPPQLAASFGPQARATLDALANGQSVSCQIRDRDRDNRLLATCHSSNGSDMALELLRRGLAVTARGSITGTELATPYLAAETAAQNQKIGLWSVTMPPPVSFSATTSAAATTAPVVTPPRTESTALPEKTTPRTDKSSDAQPALPVTPPPGDMQARIAADIVEQRTQARLDETRWQRPDESGFFERYQILIAGVLMLVTGVTVISALWMQKRRDRRDETRAVAAALRGELMAARGVCVGRIKTITTDEEDRAATWPRIRSTLYQAYVGRLGLLGAELARQVASIYGQSSDYASLYSPTGAAHDASKKQALETLARHIDEVLPKLAGIEQSGASPAMVYYERPRSHYDAPAPMLRAAPQPALPPTAYKTIGAPVVKQSESGPGTITAYEDKTAKPAAPQAHVPPEPQPKPTALWEAVRNFIQNHRNAIAEPVPHEEHVSEYAAMIEADMARYPYNETIETLDISPHKKSG